MNKNIIKNILIFALVPSVIAVGYFGYKFYQKKKREKSGEIEPPKDPATKEQLDAIILAFSKRKPADVFTGITPKVYDIALNNMKNISRQDADEIIALGAKDESKRTTEERIKVLGFFPRVLGSTTVQAMGLDVVQ